jgi:hypothetical protein
MLRTTRHVQIVEGDWGDSLMPDYLRSLVGQFATNEGLSQHPDGQQVVPHYTVRLPNGRTLTVAECHLQTACELEDGELPQDDDAEAKAAEAQAEEVAQFEQELSAKVRKGHLLRDLHRDNVNLRLRTSALQEALDRSLEQNAQQKKVSAVALSSQQDNLKRKHSEIITDLNTVIEAKEERLVDATAINKKLKQVVATMLESEAMTMAGE